ncbi:MAG TPA: hypothetical protein VFV08_00460 [Puia sp.]|nr:hypothetical protein [Puia sp.]
MKPEKRKKLVQWHAENINTKFRLRAALMEYVRNDTLILLHSIVAFRNLLKTITGGK